MQSYPGRYLLSMCRRYVRIDALICALVKRTGLEKDDQFQVIRGVLSSLLATLEYSGLFQIARADLFSVA